MGFTITMQSPYILIEPGNSSQNLFSLNNNFQFGVVFQVNNNTTICSVGDIICYNISDIGSIQQFGDNMIYNIIDEKKIIFVE